MAVHEVAAGNDTRPDTFPLGFLLAADTRKPGRQVRARDLHCESGRVRLRRFRQGQNDRLACHHAAGRKIVVTQ